MPALDGLRAVAVLVVMGFHAGIAGFRGGDAGVDVFFVVSGYLITALLLTEVQQTGGVRLRAFYMRRVLRLYPALLAAIVTALSLTLLRMPIFDAPSRAFWDTLEGVPFTLFYTVNIARAADWASAGYLGHAWSLAIEEQFYLVWPVVTLLLARRSVAALGWTALTCAVASAASRAGLYHAGVDGDVLYNATFSHVDGIFAGCALAVAFHRQPELSTRWHHRSLAPLGVILGAVIVVRGHAMHTYGYAAMVVATLLVLIELLARPSSAWSTALSHPLPVAIGRRSYGIYLYHWPIFLFLGVDPSPHMVLLGFGLTFAAAWVSFAVIEQPFLRLKRRWSPNKEADSASSAPSELPQVRGAKG